MEPHVVDDQVCRVRLPTDFTVERPRPQLRVRGEFKGIVSNIEVERLEGRGVVDLEQAGGLVEGGTSHLLVYMESI